VIISEQNDNFFNYEWLYLGIFSSTGATFQLGYSFKNELPSKPFGSPKLEKGYSSTDKKGKKKLELIK